MGFIKNYDKPKLLSYYAIKNKGNFFVLKNNLDSGGYEIKYKDEIEDLINSGVIIKNLILDSNRNFIIKNNYFSKLDEDVDNFMDNYYPFSDTGFITLIDEPVSKFQHPEYALSLISSYCSFQFFIPISLSVNDICYNKILHNGEVLVDSSYLSPMIQYSKDLNTILISLIKNTIKGLY